MRTGSTQLAAVGFSLICLWLSGPVAALEWDRLWLNDNQRGAKQMEQEQFASAAKTFDDQRWKAAALYRAGQYQKAAEAWKRMGDTEAHYNRGNALARSGDLPAAVAAYENVLERDPDHADARYNLELLKRMMENSGEQQEQQQQDASQSPQEQEQRQREQRQQQQQEQSGGQQNEPSTEQSRESPEPEQSEQMKQQQRRDRQEANGSEEKQKQMQQSMQQEQDNPGDMPEPMDQATDTEDPERRAAMEQWLRRIPDDPGGLLRRKFLYQYGNRHRRKEHVEQPW